MSNGFVGMDDLIGDLGTANRRMMPDVAIPTLLKAGDDVVEMAKARTPVESGALKRSIHIGDFTQRSPDFSPGSDHGLYTDMGGSDIDDHHIKIEVGSTLFYAGWVEDGGSKNVAHHMIGGAVDQIEEKLPEGLSIRMGKAWSDAGF